MSKVHKEMEELREQLRYHNWRYYVLADTISFSLG